MDYFLFEWMYLPWYYSCYLEQNVDSRNSPLVSSKVKVLAPQSCQTLYDSMDYSLPDPSVHGILQARVLEWLVIPYSIIKIWRLTAGFSFFFSFCNATNWLKFDWLTGSTSKRHPFQRWKSWLNTLLAAGRWKASSPICLCFRYFDYFSNWYLGLFVLFCFYFPQL